MISKSFYNNGRTCRVTFRICPDAPANSVHLVSSYDHWRRTARPMPQRKDGCYSTSIVLGAGTEVHFRYLIDGEQWVNDDQADAFVNNDHGETNGVIRVQGA